MRSSDAGRSGASPKPPASPWRVARALTSTAAVITLAAASQQTRTPLHGDAVRARPRAQPSNGAGGRTADRDNSRPSASRSPGVNAANTITM